ncbi:MAG TPA: ferrochelatase [Acidobacteriaceae bacterium]|jgi:ferrochelatase|nr:ferrochelatase [Acidobacteriaceae bacterium]
MPHTAILLLAHGTPNVLSEMPEYLRHVTGGRPMPPHVIQELQHRYAQIGLKEEPLPSGPPLTRWTLRQAALLEEKTGVPVYVAMRNWHPFIAETVAQMKADSVTHARVLCLAPQNSRTSTGLYRRALEEAVGDAFTFDFIPGWADQPLLAQAFAEKLWPIWAEACAITRTRVPVLFTAHSVPCRTILSTPSTGPWTLGSGPSHSIPADGIQDYGPATTPDPYPVECKQTAAAVAKLLAPHGMTDRDCYFAFQSQGVAGAPWLGPTVEDTLKALSAEGHRAVVIQPIGFLCDHVEILYDIDIHFRELARTLSMVLWRADSLNDSPTLIRALDHVLYEEHALSAEPSPADAVPA